MKVDKGYAAVPWQPRHAGALVQQVPAGEGRMRSRRRTGRAPRDLRKALKKIGVYGFGTGAGAGQQLGSHIHGQLDDQQRRRPVRRRTASRTCVTDAQHRGDRVRAGAGRQGHRRPGQPVSYTTDNAHAQWKAARSAMGFDTRRPGRATSAATSPTQLIVGGPLTSPPATRRCSDFPNNIMMYTNTPSQHGVGGVPRPTTSRTWRRSGRRTPDRRCRSLKSITETAGVPQGRQRRSRSITE